MNLRHYFKQPYRKLRIKDTKDNELFFGSYSELMESFIYNYLGYSEIIFTKEEKEMLEITIECMDNLWR